MRITPIEDGFMGYDKKPDSVKIISKTNEVSKTKSNMGNKNKKSKQNIPNEKIYIKQEDPDTSIEERGKGTHFDEYI